MHASCRIQLDRIRGRRQDWYTIFLAQTRKLQLILSLRSPFRRNDALAPSLNLELDFQLDLLIPLLAPAILPYLSPQNIAPRQQSRSQRAGHRRRQSAHL